MAEDEIEAKDFDTLADEHLSKVEKETPTDSSSENKQGEEDQLSAEASGAEPDKTEQVKAVEDDNSLSVEDKIAKIKEIIGEDEKALDAYIKSKGYHNDPAWQKQRELIEKFKQESESKTSLSEEDKTALEEFKAFRNTPDYIITSMKAQGYTQEAIDKKLEDAGFQPSSTPKDDIQLVIDKLKLDLDNVSQEEKNNITANISDVSKIVNVLLEDRLGKVLSKELEPLKKNVEANTRAEGASKLVSAMESEIQKDGVLDFKKDINPVLNKYLDENPDATQQDVYEHFKSISKDLTIQRLKTGKKQEERDEARGNLRQIVTPSGGKQPPKKTGDFEKDADALLDALNV